ncbi:hypothetical protein OAA15_00645 [bacterium]|nr:hypothetical protein [bacterium]
MLYVMELNPKDIIDSIKRLNEKLIDIQNKCTPHTIEVKQVDGSLKRICIKCLMDCGYATDNDRDKYLNG